MQLREYIESPQSGGQEGFAKRCEVSQGLVSQWIKWLESGGSQGTKITGEKAVTIEKASLGKVLRQELRPDLFEGMRKKKTN